MGKGYIKLYRQLQDCWIWNSKEKHNKRSAWIDLLLLANHRDKKILFDDELITIKKGQYLTSLHKLAERWGWSINTVKKFLGILESDGMIHRKSNNRCTLIDIVNYERFQGFQECSNTNVDTVTDTVLDTQTAQSLTPNKNDKNVKNDKNNNISSDEPIKDKKQPKVYSDNEMLNEAINDFIKHRRKIKAPMTDRAIELFIKKLNGMTSNLEEQVEIINTAIERGWKGIYPIEEKTNKKKSINDFQQTDYSDDLKKIEDLYMDF